MAELVRCGTTGEVVWPPLDPEAAQGIAAFLLAAVGVLVLGAYRVAHGGAKPARRPPRHSRRERQALGKGIAKVAYRRWNTLGRYSDAWVIAWTLAAYGRRSYAAMSGEPDDE